MSGSVYPGGIDSFTDPTPFSNLFDPAVLHSTQHAQANDAVNAIETTLGVNPAGPYPTVVTRLNAQASMVVNAKDYGVVADWNGTTGTDNATALASAVAAAASGSGALLVPAGTYYASALPALPAGVTLRGSSTAPTVLVLNANINGITNAAGASNCTVRNLTIQNASTSATTSAALIIFTGGSRHKVKDCILIGGKLGVCFNYATDSVVEDCEVTAQNGTATPIGIYLTSSSTATPTGCKIRNNVVHDMSGAGIMVVTYTYASTLDIDCTISGNTVRNVTDNGIRVQTITGVDQGGYSIIGNTVENPAINGIRLNGTRASCIGNTVVCRTAGTAGIRDGGGAGGTWIQQSTIANNTVTGPGIAGAGIQLQNASNRCTISGNNVTGWNYGIYIGDTTVSGLGPATGHTIANNVCHGNYREGIMLTQSTTKCTLSGNVVKNNNTIAGAGPAGITLDTGCTQITLTGNTAYDDQVTKTQNAGFQMVGAADYALAIGNNWSGNKAAAVYAGANTVHVNNFEGP